MESKNTPSAIVLSRQKLQYINPSYSAENRCKFGAYLINTTSESNSITLLATGSEVELALEAQKKLKEVNINSQVVSMPCQNYLTHKAVNIKIKFLIKIFQL